MAIPPKIAKSEIKSLPNTAGVYFLYGINDELLYVGKSVHVRERIQSHFRANGRKESRKRKRLYEETAGIDIVQTAGGFGASLLELQHIKERQPILNKQSRKKKQLVTARLAVNDGYFYPELQRENSVKPETDNELLGVFKSKKQAESVIEGLADEYGLCRKRLGISTRLKDGPCFYYQLGECKGACVDEDSPQDYNQRFEQAFRDYKVVSWPYRSAVMIAESSDYQTDKFAISNWAITQAVTNENGHQREFFQTVPQPATFNYDTYKKLARVLLREDYNENNVTVSQYDA